jgi:hypothetical protein
MGVMYKYLNNTISKKNTFKKSMSKNGIIYIKFTYIFIGILYRWYCGLP